MILTLFLSLTLSAQEPQGIKFEKGNLAAALKKATGKKGAPAFVFLDCYTEWCGPCKYMDANVFTLPEVADFFNKNLVNIKIDMEKGEGPALQEKYKVTAYPTYLLLDAKGNEIYRSVGLMRPDLFIMKFKMAMNPAAKEAIKNAYEREKSFKNALAYLELLRVDASRDQQRVVAEVFPLLTPEERYSTEFWSYLSPVLSSARNPLFDAVIRDKWNADRLLTRERVDAVLRQGLFILALQYVGGRLGNNNPEALVARLNYLPLLAPEGDLETGYVSRVVQFFSEGKFKEIDALLDIRALSALGDQARTQVERLITNTKGISVENARKYYADRIEQLNRSIEQVRQIIEPRAPQAPTH
jgi:thiol-disulfide isomerase/thioredoxin